MGKAVIPVGFRTIRGFRHPWGYWRVSGVDKRGPLCAVPRDGTCRGQGVGSSIPGLGHLGCSLGAEKEPGMGASPGTEL